jgi:hypothetical protein
MTFQAALVSRAFRRNGSAARRGNGAVGRNGTALTHVNDVTGLPRFSLSRSFPNRSVVLERGEWTGCDHVIFGGSRPKLSCAAITYLFSRRTLMTLKLRSRRTRCNLLLRSITGRLMSGMSAMALQLSGSRPSGLASVTRRSFPALMAAYRSQPAMPGCRGA